MVLQTRSNNNAPVPLGELSSAVHQSLQEFLFLCMCDG